MSYWDVKQFESGNFKNRIDKRIALSTFGLIVAGIIEFHTQQRSHGRGIAEQKIYVLLCNPVYILKVVVAL